jgi:ATP-dependent DNA helicase PIF1
MVYKARDSGPMKDKMEQNTLAPTTLQLKVNAQVMMLKNQSGGSGGLVNGSLGVVVGFVNRPAENDNMVGSDGRNKGSFNAPGEELPLVKFTMDNGTVREMVVGREEWKIELPNGDVQGSRIQIPLGLAWSLSIHKSQGQTLPKVKVDLGKVFEKGNPRKHCGLYSKNIERNAVGQQNTDSSFGWGCII